MKRYTLALFILLAASNISAATRRRAAITEPARTAPGSWQWTAQEFCTMTEASALASIGKSSDDAPLIAPTRDAQPRFILFQRVYADFVFTPTIPLQWSVFASSSSAYQSYASETNPNRGMVSTANGEHIVWSATGTMQCQ